MGKCNWSSFVRSVKLVITFAFSHIGLCAFVAGYSVAGAFLFRELEQRYIIEHYDSAVQRNNCLNDIYNITEQTGDRLNTNHWRSILNSTIWQEQMADMLTTFEKNLKTAVENQLYDQGPNEQKERWSVIGSLFYCFTVITTIGYGHVSPRTLEGKMVTIAYAILGIPLMLLCLSNIGDSMATFFRFMYRRVCCACCRTPEEEAEGENSTGNLQTPSNSNGTAEPPPYTPPPKYKPNRRNMLISPPISATIHRGSDNPLRPTTEDPAKSPSRSTTPRLPKSSQAHLNLPDVEANRIIAECAAYTKTSIPGLMVTSAESSSNDDHDYDMVTPARISPSTTARHTPDPSAPSSPLCRDAPDDWVIRKENGGPHIVIEEHIEHLPSNNSTRPGSPTLTFSTHHASNASIAVSSSGSRPWPRQESNSSVGGLLSVEYDVNEHRQHVKDRPARCLGKTLVVYNTLSGDALLEQSKVARRMALMNKGGFGPKRQEITTVFTDPVSGQAVDGDMLGLNYRPIPPDTSDADNRVPIPIVLAFLASYLGIGALLFHWLEDWALLDACYFCFITLSTIGFGDFVPGKSLGFETREAQIKLVTGSLYILIGLAVLAMSFNLVQEEVVLKCKAFAHWIGLLKD